MANMMKKLRHEVLEAIPPAIFFFIAFQVIGFTHALTLGDIGVEWSTFWKATIAALVIAQTFSVSSSVADSTQGGGFDASVEPGNSWKRRPLGPS